MQLGIMDWSCVIIAAAAAFIAGLIAGFAAHRPKSDRRKLLTPQIVEAAECIAAMEDDAAGIVKYVQKTILKRGRIWEGCRPAYEAGTYHNRDIDQLLAARIMVPSRDPNGGYVLPDLLHAEQPKGEPS